MRTKLLAAVATFAFIATGVAASAQDNQRQEQRPAERGAAAPGRPSQGEAPRGEAPRPEQPRAAQGERRDEQGASGRGEQPNAAQNEKREQPNAAQNEKREQPNGEGQKPAPRAAQGERKEEPANGKTGQNEGAAKNRPANAEGEPARTGQGQPNRADQPARTESGQNNRAEPTNRAEQGQAGRANEAGGAARRAQSGPARVTGNIKVSQEHATRVSETLRRDSRPVHVDFDVRVGVRVPERVEIRPLPTEIVEIVPEYRGYDYFVDEDDEIVFVSPESHEIVGTIAYGDAVSTGRVARARPCPPEE